WDGDIASKLVEGVDQFLLRQLDESVAKRDRHWNYDFSTPERYVESIEPNRQRLAYILGAADSLREDLAFQLMATVENPSAVIAAKEGDDGIRVRAIRWPAVRQVSGEGYILDRASGEESAAVIVVPDAWQDPRNLFLSDDQDIALRFAEAGLI